MSTFRGRFFEENFKYVCIDNFLPENHHCTAFFLSHFHSDHLRGIYDASFHALFERKSTKFYCHELTRKFILACSEIKIPKYRIISLDKEGTDVELEDGVWVKVTWFSAGHCPGSIMLLFEGFGERVLYTGDIRLSQSDLSSMKALHYEGEPLPLDALYLDTTFASNEFLTFPSRQKCFCDMKNYIDEWFAKDQQNRVCILPTACIGFEFLMIEFYEAYNRKIHITLTAYERFLSHIPHIQHAVSTDQDNTKIHFCSIGGCETCFRTKFDRRNLLLIKPSALFFKQDIIKTHGPVILDGSMLRVCYSSHSSCEELVELVRYLKPEKTYPCAVPPYSREEDPYKFFKDCLSSHCIKGFNNKPESVDRSKESKKPNSPNTSEHESKLDELVELSEPEIFVQAVSEYLFRPIETPPLTDPSEIIHRFGLESPN